MLPNAERTYTVYVQFRGRRLALRKRILGIEAANVALVALRKERFHDPELVVLVDDVTNAVVDDAPPGEPAAEPPPNGHATAAPAAPAPRAAPAPPSPARSTLARLRQTMETTRAALERHTTAVAALERLRSRMPLDADALNRLETSARAIGSLVHHSVEQLDQVVVMLEGDAQAPSDEPTEPSGVLSVRPSERREVQPGLSLGGRSRMGALLDGATHDGPSNEE